MDVKYDKCYCDFTISLLCSIIVISHLYYTYMSYDPSVINSLIVSLSATAGETQQYLHAFCTSGRCSTPSIDHEKVRLEKIVPNKHIGNEKRMDFSLPTYI